MRIATPDLKQEEQVNQTGIALINLLGSDLFQFINSGLSKSNGVEWLENYRKENLNYRNYNFVDPSNLLKELLRVSQSPLRVPIKAAINPKDTVKFFDRLQTILDDRNDWVHHNISFSPEALKSLVMNLYPVSEILHLGVCAECDDILSKLKDVTADNVIDTKNKSEETSVVSGISEIIDLISDITKEEPNIGDLVNERMSSHSYVLQINGEVRDRTSGTLLSEERPEVALKVGTFLLARKPNGGRVRMTESGNLVAYFDDHWGYLARIPTDYWFGSVLT